MDIIDKYLQKYEEVALQEAILKQLKEEQEAIKIELIDYMDAQGLDTLGRDDKSINHYKRSYPKIAQDGYDKLVKWVEQSGEPISQYMELTFIKGSDKDPRGLYIMIKDAQKKSLDTGVPLEMCLPDGLQISVVDVVAVRSRKSRSKPAETALDKLDEMIDF